MGQLAGRLQPLARLLVGSAVGAFDGAVLGALANSRGWFVGGALWPLGGAALGAVFGGMLVDRGLVTPERAWWYLGRFAWLRVAIAAAAIGSISTTDLVQLVASVVVAVAVTVGYFIEANAFVDLAPQRFRVFATLAGALIGAVLGLLANSGGWFLGGALWPLGGAVAGALFGALVWGRRPPPPERRWRIPERSRPVIFLAPVMLFVGITLVIPTLRTIYLSFRSRRSEEAVGLANYRSIREDSRIVSFEGVGDLLGSRLFIAAAVIAVAAVGFVVVRGLATRRGVDLSAPLPTLSLTGSTALVILAAVGAFSGVLWNNFFWIVFVTGLATVFGLAIAVLADRSRGESLAKSLIFMPMAISFVGASVIWRFVYAANPVERDQIGVLNAIWVNAGGDPQLWLQQRPWNSLFLIAIMIWIQTGFAMVILSAAIKGVPEDLREAARVDGATEMQTFWRVTLPHIRATMIVVVTTIIVTVLKVYDIVQVMTGGQFRTNVIANQMFDEIFSNRHIGRGSALAVLLFVAVVPLMIVNVRRVRQQEVTR